MAWGLLLLAGLCEVAWAVGLKFSSGFTKPLASIATICFLGLSFWLLGLSLKTLPLSVAYTLWVGIGSLGTVVAGILLFNEPLTASRLLGIAVIALGIGCLALAGK